MARGAKPWSRSRGDNFIGKASAGAQRQRFVSAESCTHHRTRLALQLSFRKENRVAHRVSASEAWTLRRHDHSAREPYCLRRPLTLRTKTDSARAFQRRLSGISAASRQRGAGRRLGRH
jgi:hypothetical protein